ncbi:hypothetical protein DFH11DRAFT_89725 [Phellopilus nigrolimitatus]|nr:hypothetical protein DFH11DRAFT_89725 [Phellopilus nigrolimitatus]
MAPERTQKRTAARRHICTPSRQVPTVSRQRAVNTPNAPEESVVPDVDSAAGGTEQEIPSSARKVRGALVDSGVDNLEESAPVAFSDCTFVSILLSTAQAIAGATVGQNYNPPHDNRPNGNPLREASILVDELFHRTEENTVDCIDLALLMLNPATTVSTGNSWW